MSNLDYIKELGIGVETPEPNDTEVKVEEETQEESEKDFVQDSSQEEPKIDTEQSELMESLKKQIDGMEKRISDKDDYIKSLQNESKAKE